MDEVLAERRRHGLWREEREYPAGPRDREGRIHLGSNSYLSLADDPRLAEVVRRAVLREGLGTGASAVVGGSRPSGRRLLRTLCAWKGMEDGLLFPSGYQANLTAVAALAQEGAILFSDQLNHASLIDGCRLGRGRVVIYPHADADALRRLLQQHPARQRVVLTEGLFSMDGDVPPLLEIQRAVREEGALLLVDDAHATGVLGRGGAGSTQGLARDGLLVTGTLSKALGSQGGFLLGERRWIERVRQMGRGFLFSTAPSPVLAAGALWAVGQARRPGMQEDLLVRSVFLRQSLRALGLVVGGGQGPILPVRVGDAEVAVRLQKALWERGVIAPAIRPPTVPKGESRLRLSVQRGHTYDDLQRVTEAFAEVRELFPPDGAEGGEP